MGEEYVAQGGCQCKFTSIVMVHVQVATYCMKRLASKFAYTGNLSRVEMHVSTYKLRAA